MKGFYFITDSTLSLRGNCHDVRQAVAAGATIVQYREKEASSKCLYEEALVLKKICAKIPFIINDRVDIALAIDASGVHLGSEDFPYLQARKILGKKKIIGLSVHSVSQALWAQKNGADYLGVGPIFATATKTDAKPPCGILLIQEIKKRCRIPIVAIGGINLNNVQQVVDCGADAVCAISATVKQKNIKEAVKNFQDFFNRSS